MLPISLIVTGYNEVDNVPAWCASLLQMDALPAELIVVDSESTDGTVAVLRALMAQAPFSLRIINEKCTIAEGRNRAAAAASQPLLAITDFGVTFERAWLRELYCALLAADWVGGVYRIAWETPTQRSYSRLFDVPPGSLREAEFLPSSRSFGVTKKLFHEMGGYATHLVVGEDTEFVLRLRASGARYALARSATVNWLPRETLKQTMRQHYRYAYWDGVAGQNNSRVLILAFFGVTTVLPLAVTVAAPLWGLAAWTVGGVLLFAKTTRNVLRSSHNSLATPRDMLVYGAITAASSIGFVRGSIRRLVKRCPA